MEVLVNIGKFILGAVLKVVVLTVAALLIWLIICIIIENEVKTGAIRFINSKGFLYIAAWFLGSWVGILSGDIQKTVVGLLMFFAPLILIAVATPNPDIELYDSMGNLWTLRKG